MKEQKTAVIYARQSFTQEEKSASITEQIENCQRWCTANGVMVRGVFQDENTSSELYDDSAEGHAFAMTDKAFRKWQAEQKTKGRKKYKKQLASAFQLLPDVDFFVVNERTRFYRNPSPLAQLDTYFLNRLKEHGVALVEAESGRIDYINSNIDIAVHRLLAAYEMEKLTERRNQSIAVVQAKRERGEAFSNAFGTVYHKPTQTISFDSEKSAIIRYVYSEVEKYTPYLQIIRAVNEKWPEHFARCFYESGFYHITRNPVYCGYMRNKDGLLIRNVKITDPVISFEQWQRIQDLMNGKKKNPPKAKYRWLPFSGLLYCGYCGSRLVSGTDKTGTYYYCKGGRDFRQTETCRGARVVMTTEKDTYCGLKEAIAPILIMALFAEMDRQEQIETASANIDALKVDLQNMRTKQSTVTDLYLKGLLTAEQLESSLAGFKEQIAELNTKIATAEHATRKDETTKHLETMYKRFQAERFIAGELSNAEYETMLKQAVKRIDIFNDYIKVQTAYGDFTLPRYIHKNRRHFPLYEVIVNGRTAETLTCRVVYYTGKKSVLAEFDRMRIETR